ncbi:MAG: DUF2442 domain-containing protein [Candidatus Schekmanbacteria bacterium]|nr:DUF2442 domain-containing protein [Candidatus Schekmanbacteria bacterium]
MNKYHEITNIHFEGNTLALTIDGENKFFSLDKISLRLLNASAADRNNYAITPSGYGIHWPSLDEDLSIDGILGIIHKRNQKKRAA